MSWKSRIAPDGMPEWTGVDTIVNGHYPAQKSAHGFGSAVIFAALFGCAIGILAMLGLAASDVEEGQFRNVLAQGAIALVLGLAAWGLVRVERSRQAPFPLLVRRWRLKAYESSLRYDAAPFPVPVDPFQVGPGGASWCVPIDKIARVETTFTKEWQQARFLPGGRSVGELADMVLISEAEMQSFLFLADGSRRVFQTVNADRESAVTLAHSVRSWLEEMKAKASVQPGSVQAQTANDRREGFDI